MKNNLFKRASAIHAVKCNKAENFNEAVVSFEKLQKLKKIMQDSDEDDLLIIEKEIENWKNSNPIVSEVKIKEILK